MKSILVRPLITEKMTGISEKQVGKAIKEKFNVDVASVNTMLHKGKQKTQFTKKGRFSGRTPKFKKAVITLKAGQTIDIFGQA